MRYWDNFRPTENGPKYLAICKAMARAIDRGELPPGKRLPSHRMLAERLGVAVGTVTRAYQEALDRGLITGEVGRGSFVRPQGPEHLRLSVVDHSRIPAGTLDLYQNFPVSVAEVENPAWSDALADLRRRHDLAATVRASWSEESERSQRVGAAWMGRSGLAAPLHDIFECPGVQSALCAIVAATTKPGDLVLAPALSHPGIRLLAEQRGLKLKGLPITEGLVDPDAFEAACREQRPRLFYCSPTIQSPTTRTIPPERRRAIAEIAARYDVWIVEDESAAFLLPDPPLPISTYAPERCFFIGDVWLALSLGLRTTYVLAPTSKREAMAQAVAASSGVTTPLVAEIAALWIESGTAERLIEARRQELERRNELVLELLGQRELHADAHGNHVWLELPEPWTSELFVLRAEKAGVAVTSAEWFSICHGPIPAAVRICIGNAPGLTELRWGLERLDRLIDEPKIVTRPAY